MMTKEERIKDANYLILQISMFGRRFFYYPRENRVARFEVTLDGKLWFRDDYTDRRVYVAYKGHWRYFSHGGTMRRLVEGLTKWIRTGEPINFEAHFGPWPHWVCEGDLWGYGHETMVTFRRSILPRKCVTAPVAGIGDNRRDPDSQHTDHSMEVYEEPA